MPQVTHFSSEQKYEMQQTIQRGDQMWVNIAELIRSCVSDRQGNVLPDWITVSAPSPPARTRVHANSGRHQADRRSAHAAL